MPNIAVQKKYAGWTAVALGDVIEIINEYWDRDTTVPERLVAGEHIDEGDLRVLRWAMTDDDLIPPTFNRWFQAGDVLLHSRNIKKVAQPDFGGITGEKLFILRSKDETVLLQGLVPYLLQSDMFRRYAESRSASSTNKFLNKKPLAEFEFSLPPIEEQRRLAEVLEATEFLFQSLQKAAASADKVRGSFAAHHIFGSSGIRNLDEIASEALPRGWTLQPASELCTAPITKGATPTKELTASDTGIPFLKVYNLTFDGSLDFSIQPKFVTDRGHNELRRSTVFAGDVLMNIVGPPLGKVSLVPYDFPVSNINQAIVRYRPLDCSVGEWFTEYLLSPMAQSWLHARSKKTSGQRNLTLAVCRDLPVSIPPAAEIENIVNSLRELRIQSRKLAEKACIVRQLKRSLLSEKLGV